jgi:hypothetical protein
MTSVLRRREENADRHKGHVKTQEVTATSKTRKEVF